MTDEELLKSVLATVGIEGNEAEAMVEFHADMVRKERRKVCVNYVGWLCDEGRCEKCRSYREDWDEFKEGQLNLFEV